MTEAFDRFMSQANSLGREYGDGFNLSHFKGLTQSEFDDVIKILEAKALEGDSIAINAMGFIDKNSALNILDKVIEKSEFLSKYAVNQAFIEAYKITEKTKYLNGIFDNLDLCKERERWHCIQLLCSIDYGENWQNGAKIIFEKIILDEKDEVLRHSAAKKILSEEGVSERASIYKEKLMSLISDEREVRKKELSML